MSLLRSVFLFAIPSLASDGCMCNEKSTAIQIRARHEQHRASPHEPEEDKERKLPQQTTQPREIRDQDRSAHKKKRFKIDV